MVTRKYIKDYRLEERLDARGRYRTHAVYIGGDYVFSAPDAVTDAAKRAALCLNVVGWLCLVGALLTNSLLTRVVFCVVPLIACLLPLGYESTAVYALLTAREPLIRSQADRMNNRLPVTALLTLIFAGISFLGCLAAAVLYRGALLWSDVPFGVLAGVLAATSAVQLWLARRFRADKKETEVIIRENV